jgi:LemA protein
MSIGIWILIAIAVIALFIVFIYNRLVALRQAWKRAFSDIDVQLKQRHDLVPNLVETVKGYAAHERGVFDEVTKARASAMQATGPAAKGAAEGVLSRALGNLFAVAENYPQLKANANFQQLQTELGDLENKIAAARRFLNNAVAEYNTAIQQMPAAMIAGPLHFEPAQMFELDAAEKAEAKEPPKVSFGA